VRPMVTRSGKPYVHIGMVRAEVAEAMNGSGREPLRASVRAWGRMCPRDVNLALPSGDACGHVVRRL
jgi:hypothetical protein